MKRSGLLQTEALLAVRESCFSDRCDSGEFEFYHSIDPEMRSTNSSRPHSQRSEMLCKRSLVRQQNQYRAVEDVVADLRDIPARIFSTVSLFCT